MKEYEYNYDVKTIESVIECGIDISVLILFFNRPEPLQRVFEQVKKARPSKLFLYQDGARNSDDIDNIQKCRKIVSQIDWNCTVYSLFQEENYGCDPSEYISQKWAFSLVDKCIVLEDDDLPSLSFFPYCKELLELYENDTRIYRICGSNVFGKYSPYDGDYFFTRGGNISGWASWRRVIDEWDSEYSFIDDERILACLKTTYKDAGAPIQRFLKSSKRHIESGREHYETIFSATRYLNSGLTIIPSVNLISNIGITPDATHGVDDTRLLSKNMRLFFNAPVYELSFPLVHPKYILEDKQYEIEQSKFMGWRKSFIRRVSDYLGDNIRRILYS